MEASRGTSEDNNQYFTKGDYQINPARKLTTSVFVIRGASIYPFTNLTANTNIPDYAPLAAVANQTNAAASTSLRHAWNIPFLWELPKTNRWGFIGKGILSGGQVNGIGRYMRGRVFNMTTGQDTNLNGVNNDRPNLVGDPRLDAGRPRSQLIAQYFNPAAFQAAPAGAVGTAGRNILTGPGTRNWDLSVFRSFPIRERHQLEFRAEFFNAFSPRIMQFGLKYSF